MASRKQAVAAVEPRAWPADKPERRSVESLLPYARNAMKHSDAQVLQIMASIKRFGWTYAVLVDEKNEIIAGHGRVIAAKRMGITEAPVIVARGWSPDDIKAYRLADNIIPRNAEWDAELVADEVGDLLQIGDYELLLDGVELQLPTGEAELVDSAQPRARGASKTKGTIFVTVPKERMSDARSAMATALKRAGIDHNL